MDGDVAIAAAESGRKIYFGTLTDLGNSLEEAKALAGWSAA